MTSEEAKQAYLKAAKTFNDYRWDIAEKRGIARVSVLDGSRFFSIAEWKKTASVEEQRQATIFDNEMRKAWRLYQDLLREEERIIRK